jgi:hypothetical protein
MMMMRFIYEVKHKLILDPSKRGFFNIHSFPKIFFDLISETRLKSQNIFYKIIRKDCVDNSFCFKRGKKVDKK